MPANLTPQYKKAEEEYRRAGTPEEELRCLQVMLREMPKHKGTDKLQADLKQRISKVKKELEGQTKAAGKRGPGFRLPRQGAGRAVIIGGPNAGKSQLLASLTRASPVVAEYPFSTHEPLPGMMPFEDVMVQLVDTPPITAGALDTTTQGLIRGADLVLLLADLGCDEGIDQFQEVLDRLVQTKTRLGRTSHLDEEDLGVSHTQTLLVPNKIDVPDARSRLELLHEICPLDCDELVISALHGTGLEDLRARIYQSLDVVRVYTKQPSHKEPDYSQPFTVRRGSTLLDVAEQVHRDFARDLKFARVWGSQVHPGTTVKGDYVVHDRDVVELHI